MKHNVLKGLNGRLYLLEHDFSTQCSCEICAMKKLVDKRHQDGIGCYEIIQQVFGKHVGCAGLIFKDITEGV